MRRLLLACLLVLSLSACRGPNHAAWTALDTLQNLRDLTAKQLAKAAKTKHDDCLRQHGSKTQGYTDCIKNHRAALRQWRKNVRPAVNSAVAIAATAITIADKAKKKVGSWLDIAKPIVCALSRAARSWGHYFADKGASILSGLRVVEGVTCVK